MTPPPAPYIGPEVYAAIAARLAVIDARVRARTAKLSPTGVNRLLADALREVIEVVRDMAERTTK